MDLYLEEVDLAALVEEVGSIVEPLARLAAAIRQNVHGSGVVLVVDDDAESRSIAQRHLNKLGWEVAEAQDGADALLWLSRNPRPAMILLDLVMPGINGFV